MRARVLILLIMAVGVGFATVQIGRQWVEGQRAVVAAVPNLPAAPAATLILVARGGLGVGSFVKPDDLRWQAWPEGSVAEGYIVKEAQNLEDFVGSVVRHRVADGEPIAGDKLVMPGERGFLAAVLAPGMRAVSVPVNETSGIAGLVFPGDRVDIILTHGLREDGPTGATERRASETVLSDIRVLAIDRRMDDGEEEGKVGDTATLEVTPRQAEKIAVTLQLGSLSFALRSLAVELPPGETEPSPRLAAEAGTVPTIMRPDGTLQTFTLDSDVSVLLPPPGTVQPGTDEPLEEVRVIRGGAAGGGS